MNRKHLIHGAATVLVFGLAVCAASAAMVGDGSPETPWQVATVDDLQSIGNGEYAVTHHYQVVNDIDASATQTWNWDAGTSSYLGFVPIATFSGTLDGQGHTISGLYMRRSDLPENVGLFRETKTGSLVTNLRLENIDVTGIKCVGGIVGRPYGGTITRCFVSGKVTGIGSGSSDFGYGGIAGRSEGASLVSECFADVTVKAVKTRCGGLYGDPRTGAVITNCVAIGSVWGSSEVGGLVGWSEGAKIVHSYSTGRANGSSYVGGLLGRSSGSVVDSFWDVEPSFRTTSADGTGLPTAEMKLRASYPGWDFDTVWINEDGATYPWLRAFGPQPQPVGGDGTSIHPWEVATLADLQKMGSGQDGWDGIDYYVLTADIDASATQGWNWDEGASAFLGFEPQGGVDPFFNGCLDGRGFAISDLYINRATQSFVGLFARLSSGAVIRNVIVRNATITGKGDVGFIGYGGSGTLVENVSLEDVTVTGVSDSHTGALAGIIYGTVRRCSASGTVTGKSYTGGLVGRASGTSSLLEECYSSATVTASGSARVGGLAGNPNGGATIRNCYATGSVTGGSYVGGLTGWIESGCKVYSSYSTGTVSGGAPIGGLVGQNNGTVTDSFWDTDTSGRATSAAGTGKTTAEMKSLATFTDPLQSTGLTTSWDLVADYSDTSVWGLLPKRNGGYPFLQAFVIAPEAGTTILVR